MRWRGSDGSGRRQSSPAAPRPHRPDDASTAGLVEDAAALDEVAARLGADLLVPGLKAARQALGTRGRPSFARALRSAEESRARPPPRTLRQVGSRAAFALSLGLWLAVSGCTDEPLAPSLAIAAFESPAPFDPRTDRAPLQVDVNVSGLGRGSFRLEATFEVTQGGGIPVRTLSAARIVSSSGRHSLATEWDGLDATGRSLPADLFVVRVRLVLRRDDGTAEPVAELVPGTAEQSLGCVARDGCATLASCPTALDHPELCQIPRARSRYLCSVLGAFNAPPPESSWNFSGTGSTPPLRLPLAVGPDDRYPAGVPAGGNPHNDQNPIVVGTDLGSPFEHRRADGTSELVFLFGDTEPLPESAYAHDAKGDLFPSGSVFGVQPSTDDSMAVSTQAPNDPPTGPDRCLDLAFLGGNDEIDPVQGIPRRELIEPVTLGGPLVVNGVQSTVTGTDLRFGRIPGPGFSIGGRMFALLPGTNDPSIGVGCDAAHPCAGGDVCLIPPPEIVGACYHGDCTHLDGTTPCFRRNAPATLGTSPGEDPKFRALASAEVETSPDGKTSALDIYREASDIVPPVAFAVSDDEELYVWGRKRIVGYPGDFAELQFWKHPVEASAGQVRIGLPRVFAGCDDDASVCDQPRFSADAADAVPVYAEDRLIVNQTSVIHLPTFGRWVMIYGGRLPLWTRSRLPTVDAERAMDPYAGIVLRTAVHPWGPWSSPVTVYNASWRNVDGFCEIMFLSGLQRALLSERLGEDFVASACDESAPVQMGAGDAGAEYGSAIVPRFVQETPDEVTFQWLLSTWNPYRVVLMQTTIAR